MTDQLMKLIIAGGRDYVFTDHDRDILDNFFKPLICEVVSGGARGADWEGQKWAMANEIPVRVFPANWSLYGRKAGPLRNKQMAEYADAVLLFPGGKGTDSMLKEAQAAKLTIFFG